jgi:DNA-binding transcriptional LysR family regulator
MDILDLTTFLRVVETGSFTEASTRLGVSKSVVSRRISNLEQDLKANLLHRSTRKLSLTEQGEALFEHGQGVLKQMEMARESVQTVGAQITGRLRVTAPAGFGSRYLGPVVAKYMKAYPDVHLEISLLDRNVDIVGEGYDLAIRIGELSDSNLRARRIADVHVVMVASPEYLATHGEPKSLQDLAHHSCSKYSYADLSDVWRFNETSPIPFVRVGGRLRQNNGDISRYCALEGISIARLPMFYVEEDIRAGRLVQILGQESVLLRGVHAVYPPGAYTPQRVRKFIDMMVDAFAGKNF